MDISLEAIRERLRDMLPDLQERYGVSRLWVFGSRARGENAMSSDLDVLIEFSRRGFSLLDFIGIEQEMEGKLGIKVDLVERAALRKELEPFVLPEAIAV